MKRIIKTVISVIICILILGFCQRLLSPKYVDDIIEGAMVEEYYRQEDKSHDVVFIGDCEVYENFSPQVLWDEYGINSYIRGSAQQYIWQSYYLLEDTLKYNKPHTVVFNVLSLQYNESQNEAYNRMSIDGMRLSKSKIGAIKSSMTEEEHFIEYLFPILRFHSRWNELSVDDFKYVLKKRPLVTHNGYYMRVDALAAGEVPKGKILADYSFGDKAWEYMDRIRDICKENDINLILIKAPSLYPYWYPQWDEQVADYARDNDLLYIDFLDIGDETGIDYSTDTYDGGLHMNLSGAEKMSRFFGKFLIDEGVPDRRGEKDLSDYWDDRREVYNKEIETQKIKYGIK